MASPERRPEARAGHDRPHGPPLTRGTKRRGLAGLALIVAAIASPGSASDGEAPSPALLPDTGGRISEIVVSVNSARRAALRNAELVSNIVNGLPRETKIRIMANDLSAFVVERNRRPDRIDFIELPSDNAITIWTQDPFLVLEEDGRTVLLNSRRFERAGDRLMADRLGRALGYEVRGSKLHFEGGNIVSDETFALVGANTIRHNALAASVSEERVVLDFQEELGRPVLVVGPYPQPVAHIDMMLTPLGRGRLALADPVEGARVVAQLMDRDPEAIAAFERQWEDWFFGHPSITSVAGPEGEPISAPRLAGETERMVALSLELGPVLDGIADSLERFGYRVYRVPFLFGGPEGLADADEETVLVAAFPMLTYNNVLIERRDGGEIAYLPNYGLEALDRAAQSAWAGIGFETRSIEGLTVSAMYGGALRCSVKVLKRD